MSAVEQVEVAPLHPERFRAVLTAPQQERLRQTIESGRDLLGGRVVWNVNSTARGGGVAEMLQSLVAYVRGAGIDARWLVISGDDDFFRVTKRIHNHLHGSAGDGGPLGDAEREMYEACARRNAAELAQQIRPGDIALLHDPQTAGLVQPMLDLGAHVVWRAHIGLDLPNDRAREAWRFLLPYVEAAQAYVFSREAFAWEGLDRDRIAIIPPSIDPFSAKNQELEPAAVAAILTAADLTDGGDGAATFTRRDGSPGRVDRHAEVRGGGLIPAAAPFVAQVSRWDALKDPLGVIDGFAEHIAPRAPDAHLVLAGPETAAVTDDPEGAQVLGTCVERVDAMAPELRARIHLALLPMADPEENAAIVNALQRRASVVVQKSLAEGFGLTVAEGMWKGRPVVAGRVGGIQDQITDGDTGALVDPRDLSAYGAAVVELLGDPDAAAAMGARAQARVREEYLAPRHLAQYVDLLGRVIGASGRP
jgi:trehalose synthase